MIYFYFILFYFFTVEISDVGNELRESVKEEWGKYRPEIVLSNALVFGMWDVIIQIHELSGAWSHAFMSKLMEVQSRGLSKEEEAQAILAISAEWVGRLATARTGDEVLRQFFDAWYSRGLAEGPLIDFIVEHAEAIAPAVAALLLRDGADQPWLERLPPETRMRIVRTAIFGMCEKGVRAGDVPAATLWSEIWANLPRDAGRRDVIVLSGSEIAAARQQAQHSHFRPQGAQGPPQGPGQGAQGAQGQSPQLLVRGGQQGQQGAQGVQRGGGEFVVFTCGHKYTPRELNTTVLPNFVQLVESLPTPLPITAQLAVAEYKQRSISLACPVCLYNNFLRNENTSWKP